MKSLVTTKEAAEYIGCSVKQIRKLLFEPDHIHILENKCKRFLYAKEKVIHAAEEYRKYVSQKLTDQGKRSCRTCKAKYNPADLITGKCPKCRSKQWGWNFLCHGDCFKNEPDEKMIQILENSLVFLKEKFEKHKNEGIVIENQNKEQK